MRKPRDNGFGVIKLVPVPQLVHRVAFELFRETRIPDELTLDHFAPICPHKNCFNPAHMQDITRGENTRRALYKRWHGRNWDQVTFPDHATQV